MISPPFFPYMVQVGSWTDPPVCQHADVPQSGYNEVQGLLEIRFNAILGQAGSGQFLFF